MAELLECYDSGVKFMDLDSLNIKEEETASPTE